MQAFIKSEKTIYIKIILLITMIIVMYDLIWLNYANGKMLFSIYILLIIFTLFLGTVFGLASSLLLIFIMGTLILINDFKLIEINFLIKGTINIKSFMTYCVLVLVTVLFAGFVNEQVTRLVAERNKFKKETNKLVAIDPYTSFDNLQRMEIEVEREVNRVNRYGGKFTLLFLEMDHYSEFVKAYGYKELEHLFRTIGAKVNESLRYSDRKFRYSYNKFAFLLVETSKDDIEYVTNKLNERLSEHQLLNSKKITLSFHISYEEYNESKKGISPLDFITEVEKETIFYGI